MVVESAILIGFLIEVGRWSMSELGERWKLRRAQQEADLSNQKQAQEILPEQLNSFPSRDVKAITDRVKRRRNIIDNHRNAKLADREELDQQRLAKSAFEQREADHNTTIQQMLEEIAADLSDLGFDVEREKV